MKKTWFFRFGQVLVTVWYVYFLFFAGEHTAFEYAIMGIMFSVAIMIEGLEEK